MKRIDWNDDIPKKKKYLVEYDSNNSGGYWWLNDEDWNNLEKCGWQVRWRKDMKDMFKSPDGRFVGALATEARKEFDSVTEAVKEWEAVTGKSSTDEGCNCCGPPHEFAWVDKDGNRDYSSGSENLQHLFDEVPKDLREAAEMISKNPPLDVIVNVKIDKDKTK
jgi:hypothetical protein